MGCNGCHWLVAGVVGVDSKENRKVQVEEVAWSCCEGGSHKIQVEDLELDRYCAVSCLDTFDQGPLLQRLLIVIAMQSPEHLTVLRLRMRGRGGQKVLYSLILSPLIGGGVP